MFNEKMRSMEQERKEKQKEADLKIISVRELEKVSNYCVLFKGPQNESSQIQRASQTNKT